MYLSTLNYRSMVFFLSVPRSSLSFRKFSRICAKSDYNLFLCVLEAELLEESIVALLCKNGKADRVNEFSESPVEVILN